MAMNPMQKKARISFLLGALVTLLITGIVIGVLAYKLVQIKKAEAAIIYEEVYVAMNDIQAGGLLSQNLTTKKIDRTLLPTDAITLVDYNEWINEKSTAKIQMNFGTVLTQQMINKDGQDVTADVRLQEYNMITLPSELEKGEYVDIRLRLPSGEDYIVLSKKLVEKTDSTTMWIKVSEDEILTMSNAIVEAYVMSGSLLYATTYTEAGLQNPSTPTYVVKSSVVNLMNANPNITTTAKNALATRYNEETRRQRTNVDQMLSSYDDGISNIELHTEEEVTKQQTTRQTYIESLGAYNY